MATRRSRLKKNLKKLLPAVTVTLTTVPFAAWSAPAQAFFPPVWAVSPPPTTVTVIPPVTPPPLLVVPPVSPPPFVPPPPPPPVIVVPPVTPPIVVPPPVSPPHCPPPNGVPEPATVISGLIGLAAVAGYRFRRRA